MVADGERSAYDGFKACNVVWAEGATLLPEAKYVRIRGTTYLTVVLKSAAPVVSFARWRRSEKRMKKCHSTKDPVWIHLRWRTGVAGEEQGL
jgi:hypothetical protein